MTDEDRPDTGHHEQEQGTRATDDALELMATMRTGVDMSSDRGSSGDKDSWSGRDTFELLSTILLALAAIATAWAGFQSAKWGGVQAASTSQANAVRTESVRSSTLAGQQATIDVTTFFNWINALVDDIDSGAIIEPTDAASYEPTPGTLSGFTFTRMREEFRPAVRAWLDTNPFKTADAAESPFQMPEYVLEASVEADALLADADVKASLSAEANQTSDNYVVSAVLFAAALFFAAMSGKLAKRRYKSAALVIAALMLVGTVAYIATLPIEV